jgi:hypothetical protein
MGSLPKTTSFDPNSVQRIKTLMQGQGKGLKPDSFFLEKHSVAQKKREADQTSLYKT